MKKLRLAFIVLCSIILCTAAPILAAETEQPQTEAPVVEPAINYTKLTLFKGQKKRLKVTGTERKIKWSSSKPHIAKVSKTGKITALKNGKCVITAKFGSKSLTCNVRVKLPKLTLNKKNLKVVVGTVKHLKITKLKGWSEDVTWKSSSKRIAIVSSNGTVTGKRAGTCVISATANGVTAKVNVTVTAPPSIQLDQTSMYLAPGEFDTLEASLLGSNSKTSWTWSTSNSKIARIEPSGNTCIVRAVGSGSATITVKTGDLTETCEVIVVASSTVAYADMDRKYAGGVETDYVVGRDNNGAEQWRVQIASGYATEAYLANVVTFQHYCYAVTTTAVYVMNLTNGQILGSLPLSIGGSPVACVDSNGYLYVVSGYSGATHVVYRISYADNKKLTLLWSSRLNSLFLEPYGLNVTGSYLWIYDDGYYYNSARISTTYGTVTYYR